MATVTGFTSERMLVIENETVVDGEVRGDNLFLMTREGIEIDAGNVRGPQGDVGPPISDGDKGDISVSDGGTSWQVNSDAISNAELADMGANTIKGALLAGNPVDLTPLQLAGILPVSKSVNEQTGDVYTPRRFANKAALDAWTTAPKGTLAVTTDNNTLYIKGTILWTGIGGYVGTRAFLTVTIPSGQTDAGNPLMTDWLMTNINIPNWATFVFCSVSVQGIFEQTGANLPFSLATHFTNKSGFAQASSGRGLNARFGESWEDVFTGFPTGSGLVIGVMAQRQSGGTLRFDSACRATFDVTFW